MRDVFLNNKILSFVIEDKSLMNSVQADFKFCPSLMPSLDQLNFKSPLSRHEPAVSATWEVEVGEAEQHHQDAISKQNQNDGWCCRHGSGVECLPSTWKLMD